MITNQSSQDYWFGPLHLVGGVGQTLTVDDTTATAAVEVESTAIEPTQAEIAMPEMEASVAVEPAPVAQVAVAPVRVEASTAEPLTAIAAEEHAVAALASTDDEASRRAEQLRGPYGPAIRDAAGQDDGAIEKTAYFSKKGEGIDPPRVTPGAGAQ